MPGFENTHMISSLGNIWVKGRYVINNGTPVWKEGHRIVPFIKANGYAQCNINIGSIQKKKYVHRLVAEAFLPNPDNLPEVDHIDNNRANNMLSNLQWITHQDNMRKQVSYRRGRSHTHKLRPPKLCQCGKIISKKATRCKKCYRQSIGAKETPAKDKLLSELILANGSFTKVAKKYGITDNTVRKWCKQYGLPYHSVDYKNVDA